jgi:hypothetical protein
MLSLQIPRRWASSHVATWEPTSRGGGAKGATTGVKPHRYMGAQPLGKEEPREPPWYWATWQHESFHSQGGRANGATMGVEACDCTRPHLSGRWVWSWSWCACIESIFLVVLPLLGLHGPLPVWLKSHTIAFCVDSLMCYGPPHDLSLSLKTIPKSKVHIWILHIYILVVLLLPRLGEPLAYTLEFWFLHMCVSIIFP